MGEEATPTRQILQLALQLDEIGKFKNDFDGAWIDAVLYERKGHKYMREVKDFFKKFEDVSSPLYSDYEAMSSDEDSIVEKGEIDSTPTM